MQRNDARPIAGERENVFLLRAFVSPHNVRQFRLRLPVGHASFEPRDHVDTRGHLIAVFPRHIQRLRTPQIQRLNETEIWRQHTDYCVALIVERNRAANDTRVGIEAALPQSVADDGDALAAGTVLRREKIASERELRAEHGEEASGRVSPLQPLRLARAGQRRLTSGIPGNAFERPAVFAPFEEMRARNETVRYGI